MGTLFFLKPDPRESTNEEVLNDLRRIAEKDPPGSYLSSRRYRAKGGRFSITLLIHRFGNWNHALTKANLPVGHRYQIPDEEFFTQMEKVWLTLNRQPTKNNFDNLPTTISSHTYTRRFGSWRAALHAFTTWANSRPNSTTPSLPHPPDIPFPHPRAHPLKPRRTPREPSARLRHRILNRDHFKCTQCGQSPATNPNVILHIDHILPWSKGGQTTEQNLQTLCNQCNHGKSNNP